MTFLTVYLVALFAIESRMVISGLGAVGAPSQLLALIGLGWWVYHQVQRPEPTGWGTQPVRIALLLLTISFSASYVMAMNRPIAAVESSTANIGMVSLFGWLGVALLANDGIVSRERFDVLTRRLVFAGGALALLGLAQFVTNSSVVDAIQIPGLTANAPSFLANREGFTRPAGTALHPIEFGAVLTTLLPLAITQARTRPGVGVIRSWFPVCVMGLAVLLSNSRSAFLCAVVALVVLAAAWSPRARLLGAVAALGMLSFVAMAVPGMLRQVLSLFTGASTDPSVLSRTGSYEIVGEFFLNSPVFGRGYSTFLPSYRILDNAYLGLLVEVGVLGLLTFLGLLVAVGICVIGVRRHSQDMATSETAQALVAGVAASAVGLATFDGLSFPMSAGVLFLVLGMAGSMWRLVRLYPPAGNRPSGLEAEAFPKSADVHTGVGSHEQDERR